MPLPVDNIAPGQSATFTFNVTAPNAPGSYPFQWGMQREGYGAFGPGTAPVSVNVVAPWNDAQVVSMSVPPVMQTQLNYNVAVTMRNNGTTTWTPGALYRLGSQNPHDNQIWGPGRIELASAVAPGQQYTFNFQVKAPAPGDYQMQWGMVQDNVQWFGAAAGSPVVVTEDLSRVTFIHTDGLGSPAARSDGAGTVLSRTRYEPYGYVAAGAVPTIGFTGHVNDADTGLTYMQQRYYDPVAGRFLSIDPVVTDANTGGSFNRYSYASNNPYKYLDPDGRNPKLIADFALNVALNVVTTGEVGLLSAAKETALGALNPLKTLQTAGKLAGALKKSAEGTAKIVSHPSQRAARRAAEREAGMGKHGGRENLPDQKPHAGSQSPQGDPGVRTEVRSTDTGNVVHHDASGHRDGNIPPHYGVDAPGKPTTHHTYPTNHDPSTNR